MRFALPLALLVMSGCKSAETPPGDAGLGGHGPAPTTAATDSNGSPITPHGGAPVKVVLHPTTTDDKEVDLGVDVEVRMAFNSPAKFTVSLPPGATLTKGATTGAVDLGAVGTQHFDLHVSSPTPLIEAAPVHVIVEWSNGASGFHADRAYPEHNVGVGHGSGPGPMGGRPPGPKSSN